MTASVASRTVSPQDAARAVQPGMHVRFPTGHNSQLLADALVARAVELGHLDVAHTAAIGNFVWLDPGLEDSVAVTHEHWASPKSWPAMKERRHDYLPMPFSLRFKAARDGRPADECRPMEVVCVQVSPPDASGRVNLGGFPWDAPEYMQRADLVLAEIVPNWLVVDGESWVPADLVTHFVAGPPVPDMASWADAAVDPTSEALAANLVPLIHDGDCLQIGAGTATFGMSVALARLLGEHNDIGWHSEATPPVIPPLIGSGVINSRRVAAHPGVSVSAGWTVAGEDREIVERSPRVQGWQIGRVVDPTVVASIADFKAINTVIMMDLTGQAAAETVGTAMHGGTGGLLELTIGALWSPGGRSITILPATDPSGTRSRIVPVLPEGTQGTVPRTLADTVVTEHGVAHLWGKTVRERAAAITEVAAPEFRDELRHEAQRLFHP